MPKILFFFLTIAILANIYACHKPGAEGYFLKGYNEFTAQDYPQAITDFNKALALKNDIAEAYYYRAGAEFNLSLYTAAINDYNKAIALNPLNSDGYKFRGLTKYKNGDSAGACKDWNIALSHGNRRALHYIQLYCK